MVVARQRRTVHRDRSVWIVITSRLVWIEDESGAPIPVAFASEASELLPVLASRPKR